MDFVQRAGLRPLRFRAQDSNLRFWVQRPVSCRLDDPGMSCDLRAAVGPEGFEPSPHRLRAECAPITPRTRCLAPPRCRRRGTQGIRTLISRVKSPVPYRWANVPSCDRCCFRFIRVLLSQMRQRPPRSVLGGLCGCTGMTLSLLWVASFADSDLPLEARRRTQVSCHPRVCKGQIHGIGLNDPWVMHYELRCLIMY